LTSMTFEKTVSIPIPNRTSKPRTSGLTMVIDKGMGLSAAKDLVDTAGDYVDVVKLTFGTSRVMNASLVKRKIRVFTNARIDVMPGGTLLEVAAAQNKVPDFLKAAKGIGFTAIEVSDGTIKMSDDTRLRIIKSAVDRKFKVLPEVGKKQAQEDLGPEQYVEGLLRDLREEIWAVIIEAREAGRGVGIYDDKGDVDENRFEHISQKVDMKRIMFEAPEKKQQTYFVQKFGCNVNLGNIQPQDVIALEALRCGLRADTVPADYRSKIF